MEAREHYAVKKYPIPPTFQEILRDFTLECLRDQPKNVYEYGAQYFAAIDEGREFVYQPDGQSSPGQSPRQAQDKESSK